MTTVFEDPVEPVVQFPSEHLHLLVLDDLEQDLKQYCYRKYHLVKRKINDDGPSMLTIYSKCGHSMFEYEIGSMIVDKKISIIIKIKELDLVSSFKSTKQLVWFVNRYIIRYATKLTEVSQELEKKLPRLGIPYYMEHPNWICGNPTIHLLSKNGTVILDARLELQINKQGDLEIGFKISNYPAIWFDSVESLIDGLKQIL
jgi:hypothetical protein